MSWDWGFTGDASSKGTWWCNTRSLSQWGWQIVLMLKTFAAPLWDAVPWRRVSCSLAIGIPWRRARQPTLASCLENPIDRGVWRAIVYRVAQLRTWLKQLSMHAHTLCWYQKWPHDCFVDEVGTEALRTSLHSVMLHLPCHGLNIPQRDCSVHLGPRVKRTWCRDEANARWTYNTDETFVVVSCWDLGSFVTQLNLVDATDTRESHLSLSLFAQRMARNGCYCGQSACRAHPVDEGKARTVGQMDSKQYTMLCFLRNNLNLEVARAKVCWFVPEADCSCWSLWAS